MGENMRRQIADAANHLDMKDSEFVRLAILGLLRAEGFIAQSESDAAKSVFDLRPKWTPARRKRARKRAARRQKEPDMIGQAAE